MLKEDKHFNLSRRRFLESTGKIKIKLEDVADVKKFSGAKVEIYDANRKFLAEGFYHTEGSCLVTDWIDLGKIVQKMSSCICFTRRVHLC